MTTELVGWVSSVVLLITIVTQITKQWRERSAQGISRWLFVGQLTASAGFTVYSLLVENWVFVVTNALLCLSAIVGAVMTARFRRDEPAAQQA